MLYTMLNAEWESKLQLKYLQLHQPVAAERAASTGTPPALHASIIIHRNGLSYLLHVHYMYSPTGSI